ncbi:MAG: hypothetical protein AB7Q17_00890 [Phycisphaerae bacterium]
MRRVRVLGVLGGWVVGFMLVGGCGQALPTGAGLLPAVDATGSGLLASDGGVALGVVVAGDLAEGFRNFVADAKAAQGDASAPVGLSDDERARIEEIRAQLDEGAISPEQFADQVDAILGDHFAEGAFAGQQFFGAAFGERIRQRVAERLALTEEQLAAAREIFARTHREIRRIMLQTMAEIRLVLTDEQRAEVDQLRGERFRALRQSPDRGGWRPGRFRERARSFFERLAAELEITDAQREQIRVLREQLRDSVRAAHQAARDEFRALLTPEQLEILQQIETRVQERFGGSRRGAGSANGG